MIATQIFEAKANYNKWLQQLTEYEKECILDMIEEALACTPSKKRGRPRNVEKPIKKIYNQVIRVDKQENPIVPDLVDLTLSCGHKRLDYGPAKNKIPKKVRCFECLK